MPHPTRATRLAGRAAAGRAAAAWAAAQGGSPSPLPSSPRGGRRRLGRRGACVLKEGWEAGLLKSMCAHGAAARCSARITWVRDRAGRDGGRAAGIWLPAARDRQWCARVPHLGLRRHGALTAPSGDEAVARRAAKRAAECGCSAASDHAKRTGSREERSATCSRGPQRGEAACRSSAERSACARGPPGARGGGAAGRGGLAVRVLVGGRGLGAGRALRAASRLGGERLSVEQDGGERLGHEPRLLRRVGREDGLYPGGVGDVLRGRRGERW